MLFNCFLALLCLFISEISQPFSRAELIPGEILASINRSLGAVSNYIKWAAAFPNDNFVPYRLVLQTIYDTMFLDNDFSKHVQHRPEALAEMALSLALLDK